MYLGDITPFLLHIIVRRLRAKVHAHSVGIEKLDILDSDSERLVGGPDALLRQDVHESLAELLTHRTPTHIIQIYKRVARNGGRRSDNVREDRARRGGLVVRGEVRLCS